MTNKVKINRLLVEKLICNQFPKWADLLIKPVASSGWDNRTFHLGENITIRLPSNAEYASQVEKEQRWLPILAPQLPLAIPQPLAMGKPTDEYPWHWSIYQWIDGSCATNAQIIDLSIFAKSLAEFLDALQKCDTSGAPEAGPENFYRGSNLSVYDRETQKAITQIKDKCLAKTLTAIWKKALASLWQNNPVWLHGDIAVGNLLVKDGKLVAVIDFGQLAKGVFGLVTRIAH